MPTLLSYKTLPQEFDLVPSAKDSEPASLATPYLRLDPLPNSVHWDLITMHVKSILTLVSKISVDVVVRSEDENQCTMWLAFLTAKVAVSVQENLIHSSIGELPL